MKVIKDWMAERVIQLLGIEDEVVVEYAIGMLEEPVRHIPPSPSAKTYHKERKRRSRSAYAIYKTSSMY